MSLIIDCSLFTVLSGFLGMMFSWVCLHMYAISWDTYEKQMEICGALIGGGVGVICLAGVVETCMSM